MSVGPTLLLFDYFDVNIQTNTLSLCAMQGSCMTQRKTTTIHSTSAES